jgi:hypothetical protein
MKNNLTCMATAMLLITLAISGPVLAQGRGSEKPNVVLMLADNVGASDVLAKEPPIKPGTPDSYTPGR